LEQCDSNMLKGLISVAEKLAICNLELTFAENTSPDDLGTLFNCYTQLVSLSLTESEEGSGLVSDNILDKLDKKILHTLRLEDCRQITTKCLHGFTHLTELELIRCEQISTDDLVKNLPEACPELAQLILKQCIIKFEEIEQLKKLMPGLNVQFYNDG